MRYTEVFVEGAALAVSVIIGIGSARFLLAGFLTVVFGRLRS